ncbi:MAG: hypothetical protein A2079_04285 [Geobacteraceae bacterium GWC2_48_7]|nr:MAG: hypothetical protein A2079_04285 [Geobacteraceae bacterium GWC2_48_7]
MLLVVLLLLMAMSASAAPLRVYVADMNAIGVQNRDDMKIMLQTLLASRLNGQKIIAVASASEADAVVTGTYMAIGKVFSLDALAKTAGGKTLTRAFIQGENQDELIPAVTKLAEKLTAELITLYSTDQTATVMPQQRASTPASSDFIKTEQQVRSAPVSEFIKPREYEKNPTAGGWLSKRLDGAANLMAVGKILPDGSRELFLVEDRRVAYYRQGNEMKLIAETAFRNSEKIISVDTMETSDGNLDIYLTIIRADELASQVWQTKGDKLVKVAEGLPYFFRAFSLAGGPKKLYAQSMGRDADFYGDIAEATRNGSKITVKNNIKMPRYGNIYSFNQFVDKDKKVYSLVLSKDNYLIVYNQKMTELWRSNDKFGGSELYFQKEDLDNVRTTGDKNRWIFLDQKIQVTSQNEVVIGKNEGFWVLGNARSYKKGAVYCFVWNGSSLEEKWRTRDTQNYMPDYLLDESRNELLMLQIVQRSGINVRGASSLSIKKVE